MAFRWVAAAGMTTAAEPTTNVEDFVEIGTIAETHGVYGELRVRSLTDFPQERFETVQLLPRTSLLMQILEFVHVQYISVHGIRLAGLS
jgi:ribosomal 30S subunit maturation factor RimM